ncbi:acetaldehyde dehydrogenase (acetylating) [Bradyrhizobium sp. Arg237L]|uniref:acetaldehyde dehydrogenase (acetylating) n=1 Tax=Bradyrhizobium sp. Arg237L TaxID=3003352 RepID=UPI00249F0D39|nr:acetaldehyde dehydrogenase (acetylating) [Bradyrhizobium sp. Arg237L]MDI4234174.1 acetaldehyde dehydrogenase (acetylating) [Bradyrhizobium sp. Arg237L]
MSKAKVAIIGSGNIGTDLMIKVMRSRGLLEMGALVGVDPSSDGLARAKRLDVPTTAEGLEGLRRMPDYADIRIVFDATSASAHKMHAPILEADGKLAIDLTPAAVGPFVVPPVNLDQHISRRNMNMVTCGGQATVPIVAALSRVATVHYGEIVASIASRSAGPGTRANIDEFTETTSHAIEVVGGAKRGKAIIILNPAEPPLMMRDTVFVLTEAGHEEAMRHSVRRMVDEVGTYVPGYRLKQEVQFDLVAEQVLSQMGVKAAVPMCKVSVFLEVEGAAHYLPAYSGNLDIMTAAALRTGERFVEMQEVRAS